MGGTVSELRRHEIKKKPRGGGVHSSRGAGRGLAPARRGGPGERHEAACGPHATEILATDSGGREQREDRRAEGRGALSPRA